MNALAGQGAARLQWSTLTVVAVMVAVLIAAPVLSVFSNVFIGETGGTLRTVEAHGDPADAVVRQATDEEADLIVVGTRGLNVAQRTLLGSVSTKIVHHAPCDVLVVR